MKRTNLIYNMKLILQLVLTKPTPRVKSLFDNCFVILHVN